MRTAVMNTIKNYNMILPNDNIVVGLSGGADSVALLHILVALKYALKIGQIFAVHINHGLRGKDATNDETFVQNLCDNMHIPLKIYDADVKGLAKAEKLSIEEAGRKLRYIYLNQASDALGGNCKIATGHHQNDNAETVIMNLARGAGLRGLCGIPPISGNTGSIIRPLLDVSRTEIEAYTKKHNLDYVQDASNHSQTYTRNRVRHTVLPAMETAINPKAVRTIATNTTWLRAEEEYIEEIAQETLIACTVKEIGLSIPKLENLHPAIARRVIRLFIAQYRQLSDITVKHVQAVLDLTRAKTGKEAHIPGLIARREYACLTLTIPTEATSFGEYKLTDAVFIPPLGKTISLTHTTPNKKPLCTKIFDYDMVKEPLVLRTRHSGDKITLGGNLPFTKKLQNYFIDEKIPKAKRDSIPIIASGSDVLWIMDSKNTVSSKYSPHQDSKNLCWVNIWSDTDDQNAVFEAADCGTR